MKQLKTLVFGLLLPCVLTLCWFSTAKGDQVVFHRQTIRTDVDNVNDARLLLNGTVKQGVLTTRGDPERKVAAAIEGTSILVFAQNTFGTLNRGALVDIDYGGAGATASRIGSGTWTTNGQFAAIVVRAGEPMKINLNPRPMRRSRRSSTLKASPSRTTTSSSLLTTASRT